MKIEKYEYKQGMCYISDIRFKTYLELKGIVHDNMSYKNGFKDSIITVFEYEIAPEIMTKWVQEYDLSDICKYNALHDKNKTLVYHIVPASIKGV